MIYRSTIVCLVSCLALPVFGCVKRTISISSVPEGALVWVNDREVGRTPLVINFTYYGEYDIRLELDGFEPVMSARWAKAPVWDAPIIDLVTEVVAPHSHSRVVWDFVLEPRNDNPEQLVDTAITFRGGVGFSE